MAIGFRVSGRIGKPVAEVFDAVVNPDKLSGYFTTLGGASAPLVAGTTVTWWKTVPVEVDEVVPDKRIVLRWDAEVEDGRPAYKTRIEMGSSRWRTAALSSPSPNPAGARTNAAARPPTAIARAGRRCCPA